jgi:hypothetical protein
MNDSKKLELNFTSKYDFVKSVQLQFGLDDEECTMVLWLLDMWDKKQVLDIPTEFKITSFPTPESNFDLEPSIPDHKGERVITWDRLDRRTEPNTHLHFEWRCPYCNTMNEHNTTIPHGLAEIVCQDKECEAFMYLEKVTES